MTISTTTTFCLFVFCGSAILLHILSVFSIVLRSNRNQIAGCTSPLPPVTIVRPISGREQYLHDTLKSTFELKASNLEIIFCAAHASDPAVEVARNLLEAYPNNNARLLIGIDRISENPKLNNCVKGWRAAQADFVILIDSNVKLPQDYLNQMFNAWDASTGLVSSPPVGDAPRSFWANVECAFLNTHQARWQLFADELGLGFAQGKNLMLRKSILESIGGIAKLAQEPAEDAAATKAVRAAGLKVRLSCKPFAQPLGMRSLSEILKRQVRWARLRRATFPIFYLPEIFSGSVLPIAAGLALALRIGIDPFLTMGLLLLMWYGSELILARHMQWHLSIASPIAMLTRDLLLPAIWVAGFVSNDFEWQGHQMSAKREPTEAQAG